MVTNQPDVEQARALSILGQKKLACLWNQTRAARENAPPEVKKSWSKVDGLTALLGENEATSNMIPLWLHAPKWNDHTVEELVAMVDANTRGQREMWVAYGRLEVFCGAVEATAMFENTELESRDHPSKQNAKLYVWVEERVAVARSNRRRSRRTTSSTCARRSS